MFRSTQQFLGVTGLGKIISDHAPKAIEKKGLKDYYGKALALDASLQIFQVAFGQFDRSSRGDDHVIASRGVLAGVMYRVLFLLKSGITPVFVFDGAAPTQKADTQEFRNERREKAQNELALRASSGDTGTSNASDATLKRTATQLPPGIFEELVEMLKLAGIPVVEAKEESDPQIGLLAKNGLVAAAATEDLDALAFNAPKVVRGIKPTSLVGPEDTWATQKPFLEYDRDKVISGLKLPDSDALIDLCILLGCDYSSSVPGVGSIGALNIAQKYHRIENWLQSDHFLQLDAEYRLKQVFGKVQDEQLLVIPSDMIEALNKKRSSAGAGGVEQRKKNKLKKENLEETMSLPEETMERLFTRITEGAVQRVFPRYRPRFGVTTTERSKFTEALKSLDGEKKKGAQGEKLNNTSDLAPALATACREWFSFVDSSPEALQSYLEQQQGEQQLTAGGEDSTKRGEMFLTREERKKMKKEEKNKKKIKFSPMLWDTVNQELLAAQLHASEKITSAGGGMQELSPEQQKDLGTQSLVLQAQMQLLNEVLSLNLIHETTGLVDGCVYEAARSSFKNQKVINFTADQALEVASLRQPNLEGLKKVFEAHEMPKDRYGPILSRLAKVHPSFQESHPSSGSPTLDRKIMAKTKAASSLAFPLTASLPQTKNSLSGGTTTRKSSGKSGLKAPMGRKQSVGGLGRVTTSSPRPTRKLAKA